MKVVVVFVPIGDEVTTDAVGGCLDRWDATFVRQTRWARQCRELRNSRGNRLEVDA